MWALALVEVKWPQRHPILTRYAVYASPKQSFPGRGLLSHHHSVYWFSKIVFPLSESTVPFHHGGLPIVRKPDSSSPGLFGGTAIGRCREVCRDAPHQFNLRAPMGYPAVRVCKPYQQGGAMRKPFPRSPSRLDVRPAARLAPPHPDVRRLCAGGSGHEEAVPFPFPSRYLGNWERCISSIVSGLGMRRAADQGGAQFSAQMFDGHM
jgi:hypothetical protein